MVALDPLYARLETQVKQLPDYTRLSDSAKARLDTGLEYLGRLAQHGQVHGVVTLREAVYMITKASALTADHTAKLEIGSLYTKLLERVKSSKLAEQWNSGSLEGRV